MNSRPTTEQIDNAANIAAAANLEHRDSDYLSGVCAALGWVTGAEEAPPICTAGPARLPSVVLGLVKTVYDHHPSKSKLSGGAKSFRQLNAGLQTVLEVAFTTSLPFELTDFADIYDRCGGSYWFGESRGEGFYRIAAAHRHISACKSFEHWRKRKPFMWQGKRLACSSAFKWEGHDVTVTSFADDGLSLTACSYLGKDRKPHRRFTITHKQLRAAQRKTKLPASTRGER
jgi:hypothetical protein